MAEGGEEFALRCVGEYRGRIPVDQIAVHADQLGALRLGQLTCKDLNTGSLR